MNVFLLAVFIISATLGFMCLSHAARVQSVLLRIFNKDQFTLFRIARIIVESPIYILTVRVGGLVAWIVAVASYVALLHLHRALNGIR
jgi:hypothetical protein